MDQKQKIPGFGFFEHYRGLSPERYPYFPLDFGALDYSDWLPRYASRGMVFWQGENDTGLNAHYEKLFNAMLRLWRSKSDEKWPFIFIQLPSYRKGPDDSDHMPGMPGLRDAQRRITAAMQDVTMMVSLDIYGEHPDIHPSNKAGYGLRLAQTVLGSVYGHDIPWQSPQYQNTTFQGQTAVVKFSDVGDGLRSLSGDTTIRDFLLAGEDKIFHPATATISTANTILYLGNSAVCVDDDRFDANAAVKV